MAAAEARQSRGSQNAPLVIGPRASGKRTWNYDYNRFGAYQHRCSLTLPETDGSHFAGPLCSGDRIRPAGRHAIPGRTLAKIITRPPKGGPSWAPTRAGTAALKIADAWKAATARRPASPYEAP
jgi:hypothetical protein